MDNISINNSEYKRVEQELIEKLKYLNYNGLRYTKEFENAKNQLINIRTLLLINSLTLVITTGEIKIYEGIDSSGEYRRIYYIVDAKENKIMGYVYANYEKYVPIRGNIGYEIKEEYRGNNLALKSLELLTPVFIENGMKYGNISVLANNESSIKTALAYGANLIKKAVTPDGINKYIVNLKLKNKNKSLKRTI